MSLVPLPAFAERAVAPSESWVDEIESMLVAGDYAESEVIVGFQEARSVFGLTPQPGESYGAESLLEVDASVVDDEAAGVSTPAGTIFPAQSAADEGDVQISLVESDALSTRELLYQLADDPHVVSGADLAALVRSKVRIPESGALKLCTGGVFDFAVDGAAGSSLAPVITGLSVDGTTVTITGKNFGSAKGMVDLARYVAGKDNAAVQASISSWSDGRVVLQTGSAFKGILRAQLTSASGKRDIAFRFVSKGENIYEQDLPFDSGTGEVFAIDGQGDFETEGPLLGLDGKLYYLPIIQTVEQMPAAKRLQCFDLATKTWSELTALPEWLYGASATVYDGKIVVEGATMYLLPSGEPTAVFPQGQTAEERVYVYDPATGAWSQASNAGMYTDQTIVNDNGQLKLVGGQSAPEQEDGQGNITVPATPRAFTLYDLSAGADSAFCTPAEAYINPQAVAKGGVLYLYDPVNIGFIRVQNGAAEVLDDALPKFRLAKENEQEDLIGTGNDVVYDPNIGQAVLTIAADGIVLVGPPADDGSSDTYALKDGADKFTSYSKRASDARVFSIAACAYDGRLFTIGSSTFEPNNRLFRATPLATSDTPGDVIRYRCTEGDGAVFTKGSGAALVFKFERNVNDGAAFSHFTGVMVDGRAVDATSYTAESGSVILTMKADYLEGLEVGGHELAAQFNDGADAKAAFTVEKAATPGKKTDPTGGQTAKTGDVLPPWVPLILVACVTASGAFIVLTVRRRTR